MLFIYFLFIISVSFLSFSFPSLSVQLEIEYQDNCWRSIWYLASVT